MPVSRVFWSWQSDTDERVTRHLIRESLVEALQTLSASLDPAERPELDHDTRDVPGTPDIVATIFTKIENASVFVADVTPIARSPGGKQIANPNVLIELGYAKHTLTTERVVLVWNTAFYESKPEDLPFDLRGRRGPVSYRLPSGASKADLRSAREDLAKSFVERIGASLTAFCDRKSIEGGAIWHDHSESDPSIWIEPDRHMTVNEPGGQYSGSKFFERVPRMYARILPYDWKGGIDDIKPPQLMGSKTRYPWGITSGGIISYEYGTSIHEHRVMDDATIWMHENGEIWGVYSGIYVGYVSSFDRIIDGIECKFNARILEENSIIDKWKEFLDYHIPILHDNGGRLPFRIRIGLAGISRFEWDNDDWRMPPAATQGHFEHEFVVTSLDTNEWDQGLLAAWKKLRFIFGLSTSASEDIPPSLAKPVDPAET